TCKKHNALAGARLLLQAGDAEGACNRAYYAMFDVAHAPLIAVGAEFPHALTKPLTASSQPSGTTPCAANSRPLNMARLSIKFSALAIWRTTPASQSELGTRHGRFNRPKRLSRLSQKSFWSGKLRD